MTAEEFFEYVEAIAKGLNINNFYTSARRCVNDTQVLAFRWNDVIQKWSVVDTVKERREHWWETALTIGNTSNWYRTCYDNSSDSVVWLFDFMG